MHVFLSYCRENAQEVATLRDELMTAGESVWWDQNILPGQDWKFSIRQAMKQSYAIVLCLSAESQARTVSGIYPEAMDAIEAYRRYAPGSTFLIPVRLSECEIPPIELDATRTLDSLQSVDLFPKAKRDEGLARLKQAIRGAPLHP
jgi:TIR domain-containing protein